ncbi:hypothetical protein TCAL_11742 [Tigriopus californicus]|uniref:Uncharacterized protein n=1 Tax=Tigriopus californicus TaxID=6832 RepID=A0A553PRK3_TIGCA|nr:hypothetical protein TCAL_11742 [Tigriopus californicus]
MTRAKPIIVVNTTWNAVVVPTLLLADLEGMRAIQVITTQAMVTTSIITTSILALDRTIRKPANVPRSPTSVRVITTFMGGENVRLLPKVLNSVEDGIRVDTTATSLEVTTTSTTITIMGLAMILDIPMGTTTTAITTTSARGPRSVVPNMMDRGLAPIQAIMVK